MKERPILFSGPMVRAILDGRKTQTRRAVKGLGSKLGDEYMTELADGTLIETVKLCPYGEPGDRLWVRETWRTRREWDRIAPSKLPVTEDSSFTPPTLREQYITYVESDTQANKLRGKLRPSIYMPRWASRITLEIVSIRVERLQDISDENAEAEGIEAMSNMDIPAWTIYGKDLSVSCTHSPKKAFKELWQSINGTDSWQANPWVWVVQFRRV